MTSSQVLAATPPAAASRYSLLLTTDDAEVRAAQRLRHRVFAGELGAVLHSPEPGLDIDRFDAFCDHLVPRGRLTPTRPDRATTLVPILGRSGRAGPRPRPPAQPTGKCRT